MPGISLQYEEGVCSVCGRSTQVRIVGGDGRVARLCEGCSRSLSMSIEEFLERYGAPTEGRLDIEPPSKLLRTGALFGVKRPAARPRKGAERKAPEACAVCGRRVRVSTVVCGDRSARLCEECAQQVTLKGITEAAEGGASETVTSRPAEPPPRSPDATARSVGPVKRAGRRKRGCPTP